MAKSKEEQISRLKVYRDMLPAFSLAAKEVQEQIDLLEKPFDLLEVSARDYYTRHKGCLK